LQNIKNQEVSQSISGLRELVWNEYLKDEVKFNVILMQEESTFFPNPNFVNIFLPTLL
jgi:hypothetical protein